MKLTSNLKILKVLLLFAAVLLFYITHSYLLPHLISYYHEDCHIPPARYEAYRQLFQRIVRAYDELNQTYWVDHGLLLGYYRHRDMLPHDGDLDLSRMHAELKEYVFDKGFQKRMSSYKETRGNSMSAAMNYTGEHGETMTITADLFRYQVKVENDGRKILKAYWNQRITNETRYQIFDKHFENTFPYEYIFPLQTREFLGVNVTFPNDIQGVLSIRYPLYKIPLPYKWKCYLPGPKLAMLIFTLVLVAVLVKYWR